LDSEGLSHKTPHERQTEKKTGFPSDEIPEASCYPNNDGDSYQFSDHFITTHIRYHTPTYDIAIDDMLNGSRPSFILSILLSSESKLTLLFSCVYAGVVF